jgi:hypothetical protein
VFLGLKLGSIVLACIEFLELDHNFCLCMKYVVSGLERDSWQSPEASAYELTGFFCHNLKVTPYESPSVDF